MDESAPVGQESIDDRLLEDIYQLIGISLGEGAATCQVCGSPLHEGDAVVVYVFRPAGEVMFQVGYVLCGDEAHELPEEYTLGVRELVVEGRIGVCSDGAMQSSWPVLLDPEVMQVSAAATKSVRKIPDGESPANVASDVEVPETPEARAKVSLGEARRRASRPDDDVVRGLFWGDQR
ncbi:hypothetical protein G3A49_16175 [Haloferax volcanii]|uniref:DUF8112 domain-containing protein n=1 Tax=Haloferax volcanii TaxID=2246 RepID=A0A558GDI5_HALVO|nr:MULTISPECIES: hypothetical protein [Haloferax]QIB79555.1 hypothetical protein G3A49_16175 [Haloferax alexandrinus]TVT95832.1 hypothetical protein FQA18_04370 [Haloferax volcanii]